MVRKIIENTYLHFAMRKDISDYTFSRFLL
jgi:hypothetical protein